MSQLNTWFASYTMSDDVTPFVDLSFLIQGKSLPAEHGYGLYSALVRLYPAIREQDDLGILTIPGLPDGEGKITLSTKSRLRIRVPVTKLPLVYPLAGKRITIGIHSILIGIPDVLPLKPAPNLKSRIVTIKGKEYTQPDGFLEAAQRQLDALGIKGKPSIPVDRHGAMQRKTIKIKNTVVGFTLKVTGLSDEDSLKLQQQGIGGRRHMGCGIFLPLTFDAVGR